MLKVYDIQRSSPSEIYKVYSEDYERTERRVLEMMRKIGKVKVELADSYPDTNIKENHYVIKLSPIAIQNKLKVEDDKGKKEIFKTIMSICTYQAIMFIICRLIALWGILTTSLAYGISLYLKMLLVLIIPVIHQVITIA